MKGFLLGRLLSAGPVLLGIAALAFLILHLLPGDPVRVLLAGMDASQMTRKDVESIRDSYGLNDPLIVQFGDFLTNAVQGNLGESVLKGRPVTELIAEAIPHTATLALVGIAISIVIGVSIGTLAAVKRGSWLDTAVMMVSLIGVSAPEFWLAMMAILIMSVSLDILPSSGTTGWQSIILPAFVLGIRSSAAIARLTRSSMLEVLSRQYVLTAVSKGLASWYIVSVHALKNALIPVVTLLGLQIGRLLSDAVVVEVVFARQGIGSLLVEAVLSADVMVVRGTVLVVGVFYLIINTVVDFSYSILDPRIRAST